MAPFTKCQFMKIVFYKDFGRFTGTKRLFLNFPFHRVLGAKTGQNQDSVLLKGPVFNLVVLNNFVRLFVSLQQAPWKMPLSQLNLKLFRLILRAERGFF